jgi:large subunit ribosomal protein L1
MAKAKADLIKEAQSLGLEVSDKMTVADINSAIKTAEGVDEPKEAAKPAAKAGKRSAKGVQEAELKQSKIEKQHTTDDTPAEAKAKQAQKPPRSKMERRGKNYRKVAELIDASKSYGLGEAVDLALKTSTVKFDASVEIHVRLNVDPRQADQNVRDTVVLPAGTGKSVRVAVYTEADKLAEAKKAGADVVAGDEFLQQLEKGTIDFDVLITQPNLMPKLGKYARLLGPKGLMPNPKSGTVSADVAKAVKDAKAGRVEYRVDSQGILHIPVGKISFGAEKINQNLGAIIASIKSNKPGSVKGNLVKTIYLTTSMGPSIAVEPSSI